VTTEEKKTSGLKDSKLTFKCNYCKKTKPFSDMVVVTRYFPAVVICKDCEKDLR
jgi:NAD-dependent SIR2 family protein deacetylase